MSPTFAKDLDDVLSILSNQTKELSRNELVLILINSGKPEGRAKDLLAYLEDKRMVFANMGGSKSGGYYDQNIVLGTFGREIIEDDGFYSKVRDKHKQVFYTKWTFIISVVVLVSTFLSMGLAWYLQKQQNEIILVKTQSPSLKDKPDTIKTKPSTIPKPINNEYHGTTK